MLVNLPDALAELTAAFESYELALLANDFAALNRLFWVSPLTHRYGVRDSQNTHAEIAAFREARGPIDQRRTLFNTRITTFGRDYGAASTEYISLNGSRPGRQTQTWLRIDDNWKIVSAHVSLPDWGIGDECKDIRGVPEIDMILKEKW